MVTCVPTSTARPVGMWKKSVASLADRASQMNSRSCRRDIPEWAAGFSARRERKNYVDMMSNCQPCLRAMARALGTLGSSTYPKRSATRLKLEEIGVMVTRSRNGTRGVSATTIVRITLCSCRSCR